MVNCRLAFLIAFAAVAFCKDDSDKHTHSHHKKASGKDTKETKGPRNKKCIPIDKEVKDDSGKQVTGEEVMEAMLVAVANGVSSTFKAYPDFEKEVQGMADCQLNCVGQVVQKITAPTVWGTELLWVKPKKERNKLASRAITGAIKLCYPQVPRDHVLHFATEVVNHMDMDNKTKYEQKVDIKDIMQIKSKRECPGSPPGGKDAAKRFMAYAAKLGPAAKAVLDGRHFGELKRYVTKESYDCQQDCAFGKDGSMATAMALLWVAGIVGKANGRDLAIESFTGALKTCYPGIPHNLVHGFVSGIMDEVEQQLRDITRLYPATGIPYITTGDAAGANTPPLVNVVAFGAAVFGVGMTAVTLAFRRRTWNRVEVTHEEDWGIE